MKRIIYLEILLALFLLSGCNSHSDSASAKMKDGFYTAEMDEFSHGWKEYLCIMVKDDTIVYAEFNAKNSSGFIKAWDKAYMKNMYSITKTYPNEYTRNYAAQLIEKQSSAGIDTVSGASHSGSNFNRLSAAVIEQAVKGDSSTMIVESGE